MKIIAKLKGLLLARRTVSSGIDTPPPPQIQSQKTNWDCDGHSYGLRDQQFAKLYSQWRNKLFFNIDLFQELPEKALRQEVNNRDGYVREFVVRAVIARGDLTNVDLVLGFMNDYVKTTRDLAQYTASLWLKAASLNIAIENIALIFSLKNQSRANAQALIDMVTSRLSEDSNRQFLIDGIEHKKHKIGAICWQVAEQVFSWSSYEKLIFALKVKDIRIKQIVCDEVPKISVTELSEFHSRLHQIKHMPLRRAVLLQVYRRKLIDDICAIQIGLWDKSYGIRWMARLWAKEVPNFLIKEYQNTLLEHSFTRKKALALEGLAELNDPLGIEICRTFLSDQNAHLRNRALKSLVKLDKLNLKAYLERTIQDSDKQVFRSSLKISADQANFFEQGVIEDLAKKRKNDLSFFSEIIQYAHQIMGWTGLLYVSTIVEADLSVQEQAIIERQICRFLDEWSRRQVYQTIEEVQFLKLSRWLNSGKLTSLNAIGNRIRFTFKLTAKKWENH